MNTNEPSKRFRRRPLLVVVGIGAAVITIACTSSSSTTGNLMAPTCPDGGTYTGLGSDGCAPQSTTDGGTGGDH
jgi:hypothetical protein